MRVVVSLIVWLATVLTMLGTVFASVVVTGLLDLRCQRCLDWMARFAVPLVVAVAGMSAWIAARIVTATVDQHADGRFGAESVVAATAIAVLAVFRFGSNDPVILAMFVSFAAAFAGTFIPWRPGRPSVAGVLVAIATLIGIILHG